MEYCEYADGVSNVAPGGFGTATGPLTLGIGGSLDCGAGQLYSDPVTDIWVPEGYYDVWASFFFSKFVAVP
jgi:hypothetical protein